MDRNIHGSVFFRPGLLLLIALAILYLVPPLCWEGLASGDETRVAGIAMEMLLERFSLLPKLNGSAFLEYPFLSYLWTAVLYALLGTTELAAKCSVLLPAFGTVLLLYAFARKAGYGKFTACAAGFLLMSSMQFYPNSRVVRVDMLLTGWIFLSSYGFLLYEHSQSRPAVRFAGLALIALAVGCGVLTKGLVGAVLPASGIGIFLIIDDLLRRKFRLSRYFQIGFAFLAGMLPVLLWGYWVYRTEGKTALYTVAVTNGIGRFSGSQGDHVSPWYGYIVSLPELFIPWQILLFLGLYVWIKQAGKVKLRRAYFLLSLLAVPFLMLNCAAGKRNVYLLPLAPLAAMAAACGVEFLLTKFPRAAEFFRNRPKQTVLLLAVVGVLLNVGFFCHWQYRFERDCVSLFWQEVRRIAAEERRVVKLYRPQERTNGAAVFYLRRLVPVRKIADPVTAPELVVLRYKKKGLSGKYDFHRYLRLPEELSEFQRITR